MTTVKIWEAGVADEAWKVMICARDASRADDLLSALFYIIGDREHVESMSGFEIIKALKAHKEKSHQSVVSALTKVEART